MSILHVGVKLPCHFWRTSVSYPTIEGCRSSKYQLRAQGRGCDKMRAFVRTSACNQGFVNARLQLFLAKPRKLCPIGDTVENEVSTSRFTVIGSELKALFVPCCDWANVWQSSAIASAVESVCGSSLVPQSGVAAVLR